MAGRKPLGPKLVHHLDGSAHAKQRMEVILETIACKRTIEEACNKLGIEQAMFFRLRTQVLQAGLDRLEPRPAGRPPASGSPQCRRIAELEQQLAEKDVEMKATEVRLEIAGAIPQLLQGAGLKKTTARRLAKSKRQRRRGKKAR